MDLSFLSQINYIAVAISSVIFFFLGSLWYSMLFGNAWVDELSKHNVVIKEPSKLDLIFKLLLTFGINIISCFAMACLVNLVNSTTIESGIVLGIISVLGFAATSLASVFIWESRSLKLFLIDFGYPAVGIMSAAIILSICR